MVVALRVGRLNLLTGIGAITETCKDRAVGPIVAVAAGNQRGQGVDHALEIGDPALKGGDMTTRDLMDIATGAAAVAPE